MPPIRIVTIVLVALALALWPRERAAASSPAMVVRTPEPYQAPASPPPPGAWRQPLPVRTPVPITTARPPEPLVRRTPAPLAPHASGPAGNTTQVINLVMPELGAVHGSGGDVVVRLDTTPGSNRVELHVSHGGTGPAPAARPAPMPRPEETDAPIDLEPTPEPVRTPRPARRPTGSAAFVAPVVSVPLISESYPAGALDVPFAPVPRVGLEGLYELDGDGAIDGALAYARYTLVDQQYIPSRHQRQELTGQLSAWRVFSPALRAGLGYWGRFIGVTQSVPPPLTTPLVTSPSQAYHGPQLSVAGQWRLSAPWSLGGRLEARPYLFAVGDEAVTPLSPGWGFGVTAELGYKLDARLDAAVALQYTRQGAYGAGFVRNELGPSARLSWRF